MSGSSSPTLRPGGRRGYANVSVRPGGAGPAIFLDDKPLRTPMGAPVVVPTAALAEAIAAEWRGQGDKIDLAKLPMTRIAATAIDRVPARRRELVAELMAYAETELLCHRAAEPAALVARQAAIWQPLLDWLALRFDAPLVVTTGIHVQAHPQASVAALERALSAADDWRLAGLAVAVGTTSSLVIALALAERHIEAAAAFEAAELDASYQIERWGEDAEAMARRREIRAEIEAAARFLGLLAA